MNNAREIITLLGRPELAKAVDVKLGTISAAYVSNIFPASWYQAVKQLAASQNIEVSDDLFNWRKPKK